MTQVHFYSQQILGQRNSQQDAVGVLVLSPQRKLYVLTDGMGGHHGGEIASQAVLQAMFDAFENNPNTLPAQQQLAQAVDFANQKLSSLIQTQPELSGMGTTLLAVILDEYSGQFDFVSVGDSPLYHWQNGQLKRINANHAFAAELKKLTDAGVMSLNEAQNHPQRHAITSALMGTSIAHIDYGSGSLKHHERLMLASDGVQTLSDDEVGELAQYVGNMQQTLAEVAQHIFDAIVAKNTPTQDNATILLMTLPQWCDSLPVPPIAPMMRSQPCVPPTQVEGLAAPATQVEAAVSEKHQSNHVPISEPSDENNNMMGLIVGGVMALAIAIGVAVWTAQAKLGESNAPVAASVASAVMDASAVASAVSAP